MIIMNMIILHFKHTGHTDESSSTGTRLVRTSIWVSCSSYQASPVTEGNSIGAYLIVSSNVGKSRLKLIPFFLLTVSLLSQHRISNFLSTPRLVSPMCCS